MMCRFRTKSDKRNERGQVMMEFLLVSAVILTLIFTMVQISWGLAWGHYVHYTTFMASRAYLSAQDTRQEQLDNAAEVIKAMVKKPSGQDLLGTIIPPRTGDDRDIQGDEAVPGAFIGTHPQAAATAMTDRAFSWAEGVQYNFKFKLFIFPFAKFLNNDVGKQITVGDGPDSTSFTWDGFIPLASDSFLGREVSVTECQQFLIDLASRIPRSDGAPFIFDNGC